MPTPLGFMDHVGKMLLGYYPIFTDTYTLSEYGNPRERREPPVGWGMRYHLYTAIFGACNERILEELKENNHRFLEPFEKAGEIISTANLNETFHDAFYKCEKYFRGFLSSDYPEIFSKEEDGSRFVDPLLKDESNLMVRKTTNWDSSLHWNLRYTISPNAPDVDISRQVKVIQEKLTHAGLPEIAGLDDAVVQARGVYDSTMQTTALRLKLLVPAVIRNLRKSYSPLEKELEKHSSVPELSSV